MMSENYQDMWTEYSLAEVTKLITDKVDKSAVSLETYISTDNMLPNKGGVEMAAKLPDASKFNAYRKGDTLFSNIRTYFKKVWYAQFSGGASADVLIFRSKDQTILDNSYLYYLISNEHFINYTDLTSKGAKMPRGDKAAILKYKVSLPPLDKQKEISKIFLALDDKIELNRQINQTLEQIAQAIFKSWFVDFDPVKAKIRAKEQGRDPERAAMDAIAGKGVLQYAPTKELAATAALFPDELEESELGEIPKGWSIGSVDDDFDLVMGQSPPGDTYNDVGDGLPFYQGKTDFGFRYPTPRIYCSSPTRLAKQGDTLVSVRAPVGDVNMAAEECCIGRGVAAVKHKSGSKSYTYYFMKSQNIIFSSFEADGTVFGSISKKDFHKIKCVTPHTNILAVYERLVAPLDQLIENNERQNITLMTLRDSLLPKLLSGEINLNNPQSTAETVA